MLKRKQKLAEKLVYIKLKLPINKISKEYENSINKKIRKHFIRPMISLATNRDIPRIVRLYNRSWLISNTPFRSITLEQLEELFYDPEYKLLIAKVYGRVVGFVILCYEGLNNQYGVIVGLGIEPRFHRRGIGTALGIAAWKFFKQNNVKEIRCEVYYKNVVSLNFIKSFGFEEYDLCINIIDDIEKYSSKMEKNI